MRTIVRACVVGIIIASACSKDSPTAPTPPPARYSLTGVITAEGSSSVLTLATIEVLDGADRGKQAKTDAQGRYLLADLTAGEFVLAGKRGPWVVGKPAL